MLSGCNGDKKGVGILRLNINVAKKDTEEDQSSRFQFFLLQYYVGELV